MPHRPLSKRSVKILHSFKMAEAVTLTNWVFQFQCASEQTSLAVRVMIAKQKQFVDRNFLLLLNYSYVFYGILAVACKFNRVL